MPRDRGPFRNGERVLVPHTDKYYEAKILKTERREDMWYYLIHYAVRQPPRCPLPPGTPIVPIPMLVLPKRAPGLTWPCHSAFWVTVLAIQSSWQTMQAFMWQEDLIGVAKLVNAYLHKMNPSMAGQTSDQPGVAGRDVN